MTGEKSGHLRDIMALSSGEHAVKRVAEGIDDDVNLGAEAASTAAQRLVLALLFRLGRCSSRTRVGTDNGAV